MYRLHQAEVARRIALVVAGLIASRAGEVRADHEMAMAEHHHGADSELSASVSLEAAQYDNVSYVGSYQAVMPSVGWMVGRFGGSASLGLYHLSKNGLDIYGIGDAMVGGHAALIATETMLAGVALHLMLPTGSELDGLGMGHVMAMPSAWLTRHGDPVSLTASVGYGRALIDLGGSTHNHGPMPLVDPMNLQELTWSAGADLDVSRSWRVGGRALGAVPIGNGQSRAVAAARVAWGAERLSTALELQAGLIGDPFTIRGVAETTLRF